MRLEQIYDKIEFGEPWQLHAKGKGVAIPILIKDESDRDYACFEEVKDKIELTDTGNINKAKIKNNHDEPVFFRRGTILKGATQTRATTAGFVVAPETIFTPEIKCVYASKGIRGGAMYAFAGYTPRRVTTSLGLSQGAVWQSVSEYGAGISAHYAANVDAGVYSASGSIHGINLIEELKSVRTDDLEGVIKKVDKFKDKIEDYLKNIPANHVRQVGLMIMDTGGVVGFEMFDHPDSWTAIYKCVIKDYSDILSEELPELYSLNMDAVKEHAIAFLQKFLKASRTRKYDQDNALTYIVNDVQLIGEFTMLNDELIHALGMKTEKGRVQKEKYLLPTTQPAPMPTIWGTAVGDHYTPPYAGDYPPYTVEYATINYVDYPKENKYLTSKRGWETVNTLMAGAKTFSEIEETVEMSSRTVDKGLDEGMQLGFVERAYRPNNGKSVYRLSAMGQAVNIANFAATSVEIL